MKIHKAVFPVGGRGTRLLPATKAIPKAMLPIVDKPIVQYGVEEVVQSGIRQIIFVTNSYNRAIEDHFSRSTELELLLENKVDLLQSTEHLHRMANFCSVRASPRRKMRGLGVAVLSARHIIGDEPFAVVLPNDLVDAKVPCMRSLVDIFDALKAPVLAIQRVPLERIPTYGNVAVCKLDTSSEQKLTKESYDRARVYEVKKLVQKPDPSKHEHLSDIAIIGRYVLTTEVFPILERIEPGYEGEVQLTDALEELRDTGQKIFAYEFDGIYYDTRDTLGYVKAFLSYAAQKPTS